MNILVASAYFLQAVNPQVSATQWCSSGVDSNQNAQAVDNVQYGQPLIAMHEQAMRLLRNRSMLRLNAGNVRRLANIDARRGYTYYLVRASILARPEADLTERQSLLNNAYKVSLYDPIHRTLNFHVAQMYNGEPRTYLQPLIIGIDSPVARYNLFCHSSA